MANKRGHGKKTPGKLPESEPATNPSSTMGRHQGEVAAVWMAISKLKPWADNPRVNVRAIPVVAASIQRFGFGAPLTVREVDMEVIAGHTRLAAAHSLGMLTVPVRTLDLPAHEAHAMALADNKLGEIAEWEEKLLADILAEAKEQGADIKTGTGFEDDELTRLVAESNQRRIDGGVSPPRQPQGEGGPPVLIYQKVRIMMTDDEAQQLDVALKQYTKDAGSAIGFAGRLVEGL